MNHWTQVKTHWTFSLNIIPYSGLYHCRENKRKNRRKRLTPSKRMGKKSQAAGQKNVGKILVSMTSRADHNAARE
jgi:hypothetical protein